MVQVQTEAKPIVNRTQALVWLRQMMLIRRFEERAEMLYQKGNKIGGFFHQYSGQEPVAVGSIGVLRENDYVITAYRDHGHAPGPGDERQGRHGRAAGQGDRLLQGQGGLDALLRRREGLPGRPCDRRQPHRRWPPASRSPASTGAKIGCASATSATARSIKGAVHEAFNMAALWKLPVIYVVENNQYAMGTSLARSSAVLDLTLRCAVPYGIPGISINGNDIELMAKTTREAANRARAGEGPTFIDAQTYRYKGHSISDPGKYRHKEELESAMRNDPILVYENVLKERGWIDQDAIDRMHDERQGRNRREHRVRRAERSTRHGSPLSKTSRWPPSSRRSDHGGL